MTLRIEVVTSSCSQGERAEGFLQQMVADQNRSIPCTAMKIIILDIKIKCGRHYLTTLIKIFVTSVTQLVSHKSQFVILNH